MYKYIVDHIPKTQALQRPDIPMIPQYLTIHSTANENSTAKNERDNLARTSNNRQASFHLVVDEREAYECIPFNEVAWHAGDGRGPGNMSSIGLEICESGDREKTLQNAAKLAADVLKRFGWGIERVKQHYDWSGKNCPRILRDTDRWEEFVKMIERELNAVEFTDTKGHYAEGHISDLKDFGVVNGYEDGTFKPDENITRADAAIMVRNAIRYITGK